MLQVYQLTEQACNHLYREMTSSTKLLTLPQKGTTWMHFYNLRMDQSQQRWLATAIALRFFFIWGPLTEIRCLSSRHQKGRREHPTWQGMWEKKYLTGSPSPMSCELVTICINITILWATSISFFYSKASRHYGMYVTCTWWKWQPPPCQVPYDKLQITGVTNIRHFSPTTTTSTAGKKPRSLSLPELKNEVYTAFVQQNKEIFRLVATLEV